MCPTASNDFHNEFMDLASELYGVFLRSGVALQLNQVWERTFGHRNEFYIRNSLKTLVHADDLPLLEQQLSSTTSPSNASFRLRHVDGSYRWIQWTSKYIADRDVVVVVARDATEFRRASLLAKQSESAAGVGSWEIDLTTGSLYWSDVTHAIHETDPKTYRPLLKDGINFYHPDSLSAIKEAVENLTKHGTSFDERLRFITARGRHLWVRAVGRAAMQDNKIVHCFGTLQDVSEQVEKEENLMRFKEIVELAEEGVWEIDFHGNTTYANERLAKMLGYELCEIIDRPFFDFMDDEWRQIAEENFLERKSGKPAVHEFKFQRRDGSALWTNLSTRSRLDEHGKMIAAIAMVSDITALKMREAQLSEDHKILSKGTQRLESVLNAGGLGIWDWDLSGKRTIFDKRWCAILGLDFATTRQDVKTWESLIHPEDRDAVLLMVKDYLAGKIDSYECVYRMRHVDGSWIWTLDTGSITERDESGKAIRFSGIFLDVRQMKESEARLRSATELAEKTNRDLTAVISSLDDIVLEVDEDFRFTSAWTADEGKLFMPKDGFIGKAISEVFPPAFAKLFSDPIHEVFYSGLSKTIEYSSPVVHKGQGPTWFRCKIVPQLTAGKRKVTLAISERTDEVKTKTELEQFFVVSLDLLCVAGTDGYFKRVNPAFTEVLGYSPEELTVTPFIDFVHPDDVDATLKEVQRLSSGLPTIHFENRYRAKNGEYRLFNWSASPSVDTGLLYCSVRDVTEQRMIQTELRQVLNAVHRSALVSVTDRGGKILEVNDNFCSTSGYTREELLGQDHRILNHGDHPKMFFRDMWATILAGDIWTGEIQNRHKSGEIFWVQTVITPLRDHYGNIDRFLAIRFDVTERKLAERKLVKSAQMASLGEMAGGVAHEINNPLAIVFGKLNQLRRSLASTTPDLEKLIEGLNVIESTAERIAKIVKGLRSFSRNAEHDPMVPVPVKNIIFDTLELCRERFKHHEIELRVHCETEAVVVCRATEISQIVMNLLGNAHDAVEMYEKKWVSLDVMVEGGLVLISVTDCGNGIASMVVDRMMLPFFTTKEVGKGTGLGLSISKGIAEDHGGRLWYDQNSPNTRFCLELPVASEN